MRLCDSTDLKTIRQGSKTKQKRNYIITNPWSSTSDTLQYPSQSERGEKYNDPSH